MDEQADPNPRHLRKPGARESLNVFPVNQPEVMIGNAPQRFDAEGNLTDETTKEFIRQSLRSFVDLKRRIRQP